MGSPTSKLNEHPLYALTIPTPGESPLAYALRCAAHLVSPPHEAGEDNDFECTDVAAQILELFPLLAAQGRAMERRVRRAAWDAEPNALDADEPDEA